MEEAQFGSSPDLSKKVLARHADQPYSNIKSNRTTGGGRLRLRPPTQGLVEASELGTKGSVYSGALELIGLGATGSAEEAPPSSASSPADFFCLVAKASSVGTSSLPLDTSTSMLDPG
jgi:hypothetical protein